MKKFMKRYFIIILSLSFVVFQNCNQSSQSANKIAHAIREDATFNCFTRVKSSIVGDTIILNLTDTSFLPNNTLSELRISYLIFKEYKELEMFPRVRFNCVWPNKNNYRYYRIFTSKEINDYVLKFYESNKPFVEISKYMVANLSAYDIIGLNSMIYTLNESFEGVNYPPSIIDLSYDFGLECARGVGSDRKAQDIVESLAAIWRFSDQKTTEKAYLEFLIQLCNLPPTTDSTVAKFNPKQQF